MKNPLSVGIVAWFLCITTVFSLRLSAGQGRAHTAETQDRFIGAWRLVWLEESGADGNVHRADCTGLLVYTRDGHMSVQVMYRNPQAATQGGPVQYAQGGYEASFGTYKVNEGTRTFTSHVDSALVRTLIGKDLTRVYEFNGNQLIVKSPDAHEHWRVAWEHY